MHNFFLKIKNKYPYAGLALLIYIAFIALGMPDGLLGIAWPSVHKSFSVSIDSIGFLLTANVAGYLISSFLSGPLTSRFGVGKILAVSCLLTGAGLIGYTIAPAYWTMVILGIAAGLGAGAIDSSLNSYVEANFSEGFMQWLHASYGIGITLGPIIMTMSLTTFSSWRIGYSIVGIFQLALALCFFITLPQWDKNKTSPHKEDLPKSTDYKTPLGITLLQPRVWLSGFLFFVYAGCEAGLGTWAYMLLVQSRGINPQHAGFCVSSYWAAFTVGRILAGLYAKRTGVNKLVLASLFLALLGTLLLWLVPADIVNLVAVVLIGIAIAPIFPALVSGTSKRVSPEFTANTIGIEMASASLGVAVLPSTMGVLAKHLSLEIVPVVLLVFVIMLIALYLLAIKITPTLPDTNATN